LALALLGLLACDPPVTSGVVESKEFHPGYTYIVMLCASYGSNGACTVYFPQVNTVPDEWDLCLRDDSKDVPTSKQPTGCVSVTASDFDRYHVGDHYPAGATHER
jgi:hypothetical protein